MDLSKQKHVNDWNFAGVSGLPASGVLDLSKLGLPPLSMRVRTGRNLNRFPLPASMTKEDRVALELEMGKVGKLHTLHRCVSERIYTRPSNFQDRFTFNNKSFWLVYRFSLSCRPRMPSLPPSACTAKPPAPCRSLTSSSPTRPSAAATCPSPRATRTSSTPRSTRCGPRAARSAAHKTQATQPRSRRLRRARLATRPGARCRMGVCRDGLRAARRARRFRGRGGRFARDVARGRAGRAMFHAGA